jgi:hypothetical protein
VRDGEIDRLAQIRGRCSKIATMCLTLAAPQQQERDVEDVPAPAGPSDRLREQRGDGHIAALQVAGLDPCEALVSFAAIGAAPEEVFAGRGWSAAEWTAARDRLAARGWIDAAGKATERGQQGRDEIEWRTDRLADAPWRALGPAAPSGSPN